jgi:hypothetical protein
VPVRADRWRSGAGPRTRAGVCDGVQLRRGALGALAAEPAWGSEILDNPITRCNLVLLQQAPASACRSPAAADIRIAQPERSIAQHASRVTCVSNRLRDNALRRLGMT